MKRHDRLVINKLPLPHLNYFLVSETCIEHISILQLKPSTVKLGKSGRKLETSVNLRVKRTHQASWADTPLSQLDLMD